MSRCSHEGFHSGQGRYSADEGVLRYFVVCDDCQQVLREVHAEAYRPAFDPDGNEPYLKAA
jgi:hypothetical protein